MEAKKLKIDFLSAVNLLGILQQSPDEWLGIGVVQDDLDKDRIEALIKERNEARSSKDFARADEIRDELNKMGIEIEDTADGTVWRSK